MDANFAILAKFVLFDTLDRLDLLVQTGEPTLFAKVRLPRRMLAHKTPLLIVAVQRPLQAQLAKGTYRRTSPQRLC